MDGRGAVQGYARAAVEDFLEAADRERAQLRRSIDDASDRIAHANKASGMHRMMLTMLIDTGREIADVRAAADSRAAEIVLAARAPAQASTPAAVRDEAASIDLRTEEHGERTVSAPATHDVFVAPPGGDSADMDADAYFGFLSGALADEEPLGPRPE